MTGPLFSTTKNQGPPSMTNHGSSFPLTMNQSSPFPPTTNQGSPFPTTMNQDSPFPFKIQSPHGSTTVSTGDDGSSSKKVVNLISSSRSSPSMFDKRRNNIIIKASMVLYHPLKLTADVSEVETSTDSLKSDSETSRHSTNSDNNVSDTYLRQRLRNKDFRFRYSLLYYSSEVRIPIDSLSSESNSVKETKIPVNSLEILKSQEMPCTSLLIVF